MMPRKAAWVLTCISQVVITQAAICQNWNDSATCVTRNDGGCGCVWNASQCIKGKECEEGMMGITSIVEPEPSTATLYYNLSSPGSPAQELKLPCMACKRGLFPEEESMQEACKKAGGEVALCECLTIFCTVSIPAESLPKSDASDTVTQAPATSSPEASDTVTQAPATSTTVIVGETTAAQEATSHAALFSMPSKLLLVFCAALGWRHYW
jgi:hypothetical protein